MNTHFLTRTCQKRWGLVIAALLCALMLICAGAGIAFGAESDDFTPDAVDNMFHEPELDEGLSPTLYEAYSDDAWDFDNQTSFGFDSIVSAIPSALASLLFGLTRFIVRAAITINAQSQNLGAYDSITGSITSNIGALGGELGAWMLPSMLAIGAASVFVTAKRGGNFLSQFLILILAGTAASTMIINPQLWVDSVQGAQTFGRDLSANISTTTTTQSALPFAGPTPTFSEDATQTATRQTSDAIWRAYVATPWCIGEFGNMQACEQFGHDIISAGSQQERNDQLNTIKNTVGSDSQAWKHISGADAASRLTVSFGAFLAGIAFCVTSIILSLTSVAYVLLTLFFLFLAPLFVQFWIVPGTIRSGGTRWFTMLVSFVIMGTLTRLVQTSALSISAQAVALSPTIGWFTSTLLSILATLAALIVLKLLRSIFGIQASGTASGLFAGEALMGALRSRTGRKQRTLPEPQNDSTKTTKTPPVPKTPTLGELPSSLTPGHSGSVGALAKGASHPQRPVNRNNDPTRPKNTPRPRGKTLPPPHTQLNAPPTAPKTVEQPAYTVSNPAQIPHNRTGYTTNTQTPNANKPRHVTGQHNTDTARQKLSRRAHVNTPHTSRQNTPDAPDTGRQNTRGRRQPPRATPPAPKPPRRK